MEFYPKYDTVPIKTCLQIYYAIFYSHLIYGCCVWGLTSEENLSKIEILQKKCIRIIYFSDLRGHTELFVTHNVLKFREIIN